MYGDSEKAAFEAFEEKDDGFFTSMGCCTTFKTDQKSQAIDDNQVTLVFDQPKPIDATANFNYFPGSVPPPAEPTRPFTSSGKQAVGSRSKQSNSLLSSLSRPWTSHHKRPVIGAPTNFRKLPNFDLSEKPPQARLRPVPGRQFRPLELSIYMPDGCGRLSPLPDFTNDEWSKLPASLSLPPPAMLRETSILDDGLTSQFDIRRDQIVVEPEATSPVQSLDNATPSFRHENFGGLPGLQPNPQEAPRTPTMRRSFSVAARPQTADSPIRSPENGSFHSRSFSDLVRPLRTSSIGNRPRDTVDEAIRELNTIVEERRHSAIQKSAQQDNTFNPLGTSPVRHIPAIAPSMVVRARSQTLTDIGSAFSTPFSGPGPVRPTTQSGTPTLVGTPLVSPSPALTKTSSVSSKSRLRTWFSRSMNNSSRPGSGRPVTSPDDEKDPYEHMTRFSTSSSVTEEPTEVFSPNTVVSAHSLGYAATTVTTVTTPLVSPMHDEKDTNMYAFPHPLHSHSVFPHSWVNQAQAVTPLRFQQMMIKQQEYNSGAASYFTSSTESSPMKPAHRIATSRRGLSVDTTMSTSSIGTSILGELPEKGRDRQVVISSIDTWEEEDVMVGVAY